MSVKIPKGELQYADMTFSQKISFDERVSQKRIAYWEERRRRDEFCRLRRISNAKEKIVKEQKEREKKKRNHQLVLDRIKEEEKHPEQFHIRLSSRK